MNRSWVVVLVALCLSCGEMPPGADGGESAGGGGGRRTGGGAGGGGQTGGGEGTGGGTSATGGGSGGGSEVDGGTGGGGATECTPDATRACCTTGVQTCNFLGKWDACSVTGSAEVCNGIDDDCDGEVDEAISFSPGELADAGAELDGGCSTGIGACFNTGGVVCNASGLPVCSATAGTPATEVCNDVDDDCDGQTDEGLLIACLADEDNDGYSSTTNDTTQHCPDPTRPTFGNCPVGFVAPSASSGFDCAPADATKYRRALVRTDADNDTACVQAEFSACVGAMAGTGVRESSSCRATDDCDDSNAGAMQNTALRTDADNDTYCVGGTQMLCVSSTPAGMRSAVTCMLAPDCDDSAASKYQNLSVRVDGDNDGYCSSPAAVMQCTGASPQPGTRLAANCNVENDCDESTSSKYRLITMYPDADNDEHCVDTPTPQCVGAVAVVPGFRANDICIDRSDCADNDNSKYRMVGMRVDADGDGYCRDLSTTNLCVGTTAPTGYRFPVSCNATLDCRDSNANAGASCTTSTQSNQQSKSCGSQPVTQAFNFTYNCPTGFYATSATASRQASTCVDGSCTCPGSSCPGNSTVTGVGLSSQDFSFTCEAAAIGRDDWRLNVTCTAI